MLTTDLKGPLTRALLVIGLSILLGVGGIVLLGYLIEAKADEVRQTRTAAGHLNGGFAKAATLTPRLSELRQQEERAAGYERVFSLLLPTQEQLLEVPRVIESLGRSLGVESRFEFQGSPVLGATGVTFLPFSLSAKGSPQALGAYLKELEISNPRYIVEIGTVSIDSAASVPGDANLSVSGSLYYQS